MSSYHKILRGFAPKKQCYIRIIGSIFEKRLAGALILEDFLCNIAKKEKNSYSILLSPSLEGVD